MTLYYTGADPGFQVGGGAVKKNCAERKLNIMHVTVNFLGLFFRTGKIFFGLTRFSCLSVRMTDNFSASFGKPEEAINIGLKLCSNICHWMKILSDRKIFCQSEKKFSLTFLEWFTVVLAIGHLISPLVFIEVKVIQFSVLVSTKPICEDDDDTIGYLYIYISQWHDVFHTTIDL
jgi:hypothetical protein